MVVFEPGFGLRVSAGAGAQEVRCVWPPIDLADGQDPCIPEGDDETPTPARQPATLLFDEDEVARLCAAAAAAARTRALDDETARLRALMTELGRKLGEELAAVREQQRRVLQQVRQRAGSMLAEAFARLAPEVLRDVQKVQLAREIAKLLPHFFGVGTVRVCVAANVAEPLAATLQSFAGHGLEIEVVPDPAGPAGTFRLECGDMCLEHDAAAFVERIAEALRSVLGSTEHATSVAFAHQQPMGDAKQTMFAQLSEENDGA